MSPYNFFGSKIMKILGAIGLLLTGTIHAEYETDLSEECNALCLQIGGSYTRANIKVEGQPSFHGNLGGIQGSYEYKPWNSFYGGFRIAWKQGKTENSSADRKLIYVDVQERIGYTFASWCNNWSLTFFSGFGYRYLGHKLKQFEESSIKFEYNEFYIPLGFSSEYFFCSCWSLGLNFTWMPQVYPTVKITPLKGARWILKNALGNVLVELPLTYFLTEDKRYFLVFKPFFERWEDGRSTAESNGQKLGLPKNSYNFWGAELNVAFSF